MKTFERNLLEKAKNLIDKFPFLAINGPIQSGKTTLAKMLKPNYQYVNLELPQERNYAKSDPLGFLNTYQNGVIYRAILRALTKGYSRLPKFTFTIQVFCVVY
ncbi:ATPase protein [Indibacter alkaliphilus LW1]|uniref:ATPase protein n=1 Tax=Indibacter alkaliphilus (strain CCUG 57479 / KCTC 22604 / LW1) TaxID=1189612 RepID=S2E529_INDAL|nr:deoxynucleoside kinase [Indibacter alkaliphilus]EOZ99696.1 ATPase protein [Indibacter alkaliphilus LW1]